VRNSECPLWVERGHSLVDDGAIRNEDGGLIAAVVTPPTEQFSLGCLLLAATKNTKAAEARQPHAHNRYRRGFWRRQGYVSTTR
jgi:hypothetical protein